MTAGTVVVISVGIVCGTLVLLALIGSAMNRKQQKEVSKIRDAIINKMTDI